jgi:hypothetical protein
MTLVVVRIRTADLEQLLQQFQEMTQLYGERSSLKTSLGCTSTRLLRDVDDPSAALVLLEFPSAEAARDYARTTAFILGDERVAALKDSSTEYFEDVASVDVATLFDGAAVSPIVL